MRTVALITLALTMSTSATPIQAPWPAPVPGHAAVEPGEHPRLFFRRADLPRLRARAETPEGQAILARLRELLGGADGMPEHYRPKDVPFGDGTRPIDLPVGAYSLGHAAGFGLLYQLTGEKRYAELGAECFEWAFAGIRDRDRTGRYGWKGGSGALRAGPTLGWYAVAYDLLHDGWDENFRVKVARAIQNFSQGGRTTLVNLAGGASHAPISNHWGMQVGGAALALLAIKGDPGVDMDIIAPLLEKNQKGIERALTEGFGEGGFFAEGDGTGSMAAHIALLPAVQAWRTAAGVDFATARPNVQWMAKRWMFLAQMEDGQADFRPNRGGYPHNTWARSTLSGGGYFAHAFGILDDEYLPGLLWIYDRWFRAADLADGTPFDTVSVYPHTAVLAFINFPFELEPEHPSVSWPRRNHDARHGFHAWRNRFEDESDVIISVLNRTTPGYIRASAENTVSLLTNGELQTWGRFRGGILAEYDVREHGGSVLTFRDGGSFAVDFSGRSGRDVMLVWHGFGAPETNRLRMGEHTLAFLFPGAGDTPSIEVLEDAVRVGDQTVRVISRRLSLKH